MPTRFGEFQQHGLYVGPIRCSIIHYQTICWFTSKKCTIVISITLGKIMSTLK